jgi:hypothetical protein
MLCIAARRSFAFVPRTALSGAKHQAHPQLCGQRRAFSDVGRPVTETRRGSARRASVAAEPELEEDEEVRSVVVCLTHLEPRKRQQLTSVVSVRRSTIIIYRCVI